MNQMRTQKKTDTLSDKLFISKPTDNSESVSDEKQIDQNDTSLYTKSTRHNQIVSLLTEIDETDINEDLSIKTSHNDHPKNKEYKTTDTDGIAELLSIPNETCSIIHSIDDP